jgi:hypothetical protein
VRPRPQDQHLAVDVREQPAHVVGGQAALVVAAGGDDQAVVALLRDEAADRVAARAALDDPAVDRDTGPGQAALDGLQQVEGGGARVGRGAVEREPVGGRQEDGRDDDGVVGPPQARGGVDRGAGQAVAGEREQDPPGRGGVAGAPAARQPRDRAGPGGAAQAEGGQDGCGLGHRRQREEGEGELQGVHGQRSGRSRRSETMRTSTPGSRRHRRTGSGSRAPVRAGGSQAAARPRPVGGRGTPTKT